MHWKQRIQNKYVHYCIANPCMDRAEQSPAEQKNYLLFSQASLYQRNYTRNSSPLTSDLPMSRSFVLESPSLPSTGSRKMTNTNLITPPFCQHNDDGFHILFCHLFQLASSNKNSHFSPFPHSVHKQIHPRFFLFPPHFPERSCTHKTSPLPSVHTHLPAGGRIWVCWVATGLRGRSRCHSGLH